MIDLDKKVRNRICANTLGGCESIVLHNSKDKMHPNTAFIKTGCKNVPRRGSRFCNRCKQSFSLKIDGTSGFKKVIFLESLHPTEKESFKLKRGREANSVMIPGPDWILVKQFGQTYKF